MKMRILAISVLIMLMALPALANPREDYEKMAGYVDFAELGLTDKVEPRVEVLLRGPLLKICRATLEGEEPGLARALDDIKLISVNVFPIDDIDTKALSKNTKKLAEGLEKKGWEMAIRVRERDEDVYIYLLPGKDDNIEGLVVMAIDDDDATFVNIVGTIDPEKIGRIGRSININGLDIYDFDDYDDDHDKDDDKDDKKKDRK